MVIVIPFNNENPKEAQLRDLSIRRRILLSKAEGFLRLTYAGLSMEADKGTLKKVENMLNNFVWKN